VKPPKKCGPKGRHGETAYKVLGLILDRNTKAEIARKLEVDPKTVDWHFKKLSRDLPGVDEYIRQNKRGQPSKTTTRAFLNKTLFAAYKQALSRGHAFTAQDYATRLLENNRNITNRIAKRLKARYNLSPEAQSQLKPELEKSFFQTLDRSTSFNERYFQNGISKKGTIHARRLATPLAIKDYLLYDRDMLLRAVKTGGAPPWSARTRPKLLRLLNEKYPRQGGRWTEKYLRNLLTVFSRHRVVERLEELPETEVDSRQARRFEEIEENADEYRKTQATRKQLTEFGQIVFEHYKSRANSKKTAERNWEIFLKRCGLHEENDNPRSLEDLGKEYGVTRERTRTLVDSIAELAEKNGFPEIARKLPKYVGRRITR
jgi:hypothetical protein